jgi:predicted DNA-binding transcriptional regulator AlpA
MNMTPGSPPDPILSKRDLCRWLGTHPSTIDRWAKAGIFPEKKRLGPGRVGWSQSAVEAWLATR